MGLRSHQALDRARGILADWDAVKRYSDGDLLDYGNAALLALAESEAGRAFFLETGELECQGGHSLQVASFDDCLGLQEVLRVKDGPALTLVDRAVLDRFDPFWRVRNPGTAVHWMPILGDPMRFEVYPPAISGQVLDVRYVRKPRTYLANEDTGLPENLLADITAHMVALAEARDDEHVLTGRASLFMGMSRGMRGAVPGPVSSAEGGPPPGGGA